MREPQHNKLFKEGDTVYFDPIFNRIRDRVNNSRPTEKFRLGIASIKKSLQRTSKIVSEKPDNGAE